MSFPAEETRRVSDKIHPEVIREILQGNSLIRRDPSPHLRFVLLCRSPEYPKMISTSSTMAADLYSVDSMQVVCAIPDKKCKRKMPANFRAIATRSISPGWKVNAHVENYIDFRRMLQRREKR